MRKPASFIIRSVPNEYTESQRKVFRTHEVVFSNRLTIAGCTPKRCVVSAAVFRPEEIISMTPVRCRVVSFGCRIPTRLSLRARFSPAQVCWRIISRSHSAKLPTIRIIIRPAGIVVSMASIFSMMRSGWKASAFVMSSGRPRAHDASHPWRAQQRVPNCPCRRR